MVYGERPPTCGNGEALVRVQSLVCIVCGPHAQTVHSVATIVCVSEQDLCVENVKKTTGHTTYDRDTVTWDTGSHEAAQGGRLGEQAYGEEVAAVPVGGIGEDGEGVGVRDGGGDGGKVVGVEAAVGRAGGAVAGGVDGAARA
jgi:hypothetical protein